jgi:hypothetical protein
MAGSDRWTTTRPKHQAFGTRRNRDALGVPGHQVGDSRLIGGRRASLGTECSLRSLQELGRIYQRVAVKYSTSGALLPVEFELAFTNPAVQAADPSQPRSTNSGQTQHRQNPMS